MTDRRGTRASSRWRVGCAAAVLLSSVALVSGCGAAPVTSPPAPTESERASAPVEPAHATPTVVPPPAAPTVVPPEPAAVEEPPPLAGEVVVEGPSKVEGCQLEAVPTGFPRMAPSPFSARVLDRETGTDAIGMAPLPEGRRHLLQLFAGSGAHRALIGTLEGRYAAPGGPVVAGSTHAFFFVLAHPADTGLSGAALHPYLVAFPRRGGAGEQVARIWGGSGVAASGDALYVSSHSFPMRRIEWRSRRVEHAPSGFEGDGVVADEEGAAWSLGEVIALWPRTGAPFRSCAVGDKAPHSDVAQRIALTRTHVYVNTDESMPTYRFRR